jgi:PAS domain S-box-containing protein
MSDPRRPAEHHYSVQWFILGLALLILGGAIGYSLVQERSDLDAREQERLLSQAQVIDDNMGRLLQAANLALEGARKDLPRRRDAAGWQQTNRLLTALCNAMPGVRTMSVIDAEGTTVASNRAELVGRNFSHRDYFAIPRRRPDPEMLYISPPYKTVLGVFAINLTRARIGPHGEFTGSITVTLDPEYFKVLLTSVLYAPDMRSELAHGDGMQFLTVPERKGEAGNNPALSGAFFTRHRESGRTESVWVGTADAAGDERITALHTIRAAGVPTDKPLVVAVSRDRGDILSGWRRSVRMQGALLAVIALISIGGLYLYRRRQRRFESQAEEAAAALRESEERYKSLFRNNHAVMLLIDPETARIVDANPAACSYYGWSHEELTRYKIDEINTLTSAEVHAEMERARSMQRNHFFFRHRRADGSIRDVEIYSGPITLNQKTFLYSIVHDITERKRMEEELLRAQKLESLGILAGGIAHDFNNLMMMVQGYLDLVLQDLPPDHASRQWLQTALQGVAQTTDLTSRLITFSRGGFPVSQVCDVEAMVRDAVHRIVQGTNVRVAFSVMEGLWPAEVDENQMRYCFYNLMTNAVEAMPAGGTLTVRMENARIDAGDARPVKEGAYLRITFSDEGRGIPAENLPRVFDPYFTTKEMGAQKGTGLGLAVCYSVLQNHGGHIALDSEPGKGTMVTLHFPALPDPSA